MNKSALLFGGIFGFLTVALGAFGAHALKPTLIEFGRLDSFETAVKYQAYHALALLLIGSIAAKLDASLIQKSIYSLIAGIIIFSGSLYVLSIFNIPIMGAITPIGGLFLLLGWSLFIWSVLRYKLE